QVPPTAGLLRSIERDAEEIRLPDRVLRVYAREPYRLKISYMMARLGSETGAAASWLVEDLEEIADSLVETGVGDLAESGGVSALLAQARAFGLHLMRLDVRQHSDRT